MTRLFSLISKLSLELSIPEASVSAAIKLLEEGSTIPFIARYRKEVTGNLDEVKLRDLQERYQYLNELEDRREAILSSVESQGKLTDDLKTLILSVNTKTALEDLYLPYKPKRRTRGQIAKEKGLEPLAHRILEQPLKGDPKEEAKAFLSLEKQVANEEDALKGASDIAAEVLADRADIRQVFRDAFEKKGVVVSKVVEGKDKEPTKFEQYYNYQELVSKIPSHRYLAIRRGEKEDILSFSIEIDVEESLPEVKELSGLKKSSPFALYLEAAILDAAKRLIIPSVETDVRVDLKMKSDREAVDVFAQNLKHLLLAAPLGSRSVIGIDPGIRTGCKCAVLDETGKFLNHVTIYPGQGVEKTSFAKAALLKLIETYRPFAIAIGNGTAGRETEKFVKELLREHQLKDVLAVSVSESGASVYSASDVAREEFPDLDLTIRGAISIARRLQDPLAELVKVDPKAIGVGQYQHDVHQPLLHDKLKEVVESAVNHVGVELNTASASLLSYVSGIGKSLATKIVKYREQKGAFKSRGQLLEVSGLGPRVFEQAAGFLRVRNGGHPLDASAVHPERYTLVEQMARDIGASLGDLVANDKLISKIEMKRYISNAVGELTLKDILDELKKPGRDPRDSFEKPVFSDQIMSIDDLKPKMILEGVVTNVAAFGAFIDIGVHQDGLVHISELTDKFIKDPSEVVSVGDKIKVEVVSVDKERKRISLTARIGRGVKEVQGKKAEVKTKPEKKTFASNPFAAL